jgi:hypothetical protein
VRWLVLLLLACVALTALKFAAIALVLILIITVLWGAYAHPGELFGTLAFFLVANMLMNHTGACLTLIGFLGVLVIIRSPNAPSERTSDQQKLLTYRDSERGP